MPKYFRDYLQKQAAVPASVLLLGGDEEKGTAMFVTRARVRRDTQGYC